MHPIVRLLAETKSRSFTAYSTSTTVNFVHLCSTGVRVHYKAIKVTAAAFYEFSVFDFLQFSRKIGTFTLEILPHMRAFKVQLGGYDSPM